MVANLGLLFVAVLHVVLGSLVVFATMPVAALSFVLNSMAAARTAFAFRCLVFIAGL